MKQCTRCKRRKKESEFYKQPSRKDGLRCWCKKCENEYERKRYRKGRKAVKKYYRYEERHRVVDGEKQKRCRRCKKWKDESEFGKHRTSKDGLSIRCRDCDRAYDRERYRKDMKSVKDRLRYEQRHRIVAGVKQRLCCRCKKWKDENQYCRSRRSKDELQWQCKECESEYARKYYRQKTKKKAASKSHK